MARPLYFYSEALLGYNMGPNHPLRPLRLRMTRELLEAYGLFNTALELATPTLADDEEVADTHSRDYLEALSCLDRGESLRNPYRYGLGTGDNPIFPGIYESSLLYTGGSLDAAQSVMDGADVAFSMAGGLHHAHYDRAAGFCVLNDCAVAIRRLRRKFSRVAYVDIDVHHGDGVQELFYTDPSVLTVSLQEVGRGFFPGTGYVEEIGEGAGEGYSVNVPFAPYTTGDLWLQGWREAALPILKAFDPDAILLQMGTDTHALDPLAHLCLRAQDWLEAVKDVQALGKPIVAVGGGGYNMKTVTRMWTLAVSTLLGQELPDAVPATYAYYGDIPTLTDHTTFEVEARDRQRAGLVVAQSIADVKELLFPRYGLS